MKGADDIDLDDVDDCESDIDEDADEEVEEGREQADELDAEAAMTEVNLTFAVSTAQMKMARASVTKVCTSLIDI